MRKGDALVLLVGEEAASKEMLKGLRSVSFVTKTQPRETPLIYEIVT